MFLHEVEVQGLMVGHVQVVTIFDMSVILPAVSVTAQRRARWWKGVEAGCQSLRALEVAKAVGAGSRRARWRKQSKPVVGSRRR